MENVGGELYYIGKMKYLCCRYNDDMFSPQLELTFEIQEIIERVRHKKAVLDRLRPLSPSVLARLKDDFEVEWTYHSNSIEGNTLTLMETRLVLEQGITIGGKSLREHFEVINHRKSIAFLESLIDKDAPIRSIDILSVHALVLANIMDDFAGRLRPGMVRITGANFTPPNARLVPDLLEELVSYANENPLSLDAISLATVFHHRFVWIHPFNDGNGRTVRLMMNLLLMRAGFPPVIILSQDRRKYFAALNSANNGDYTRLLLMMLQAAERSLNIYISSVGGDYEDYLPTHMIAEEPDIPYGQEYLSLLARRGRIDAYKEGKIWLTTKSAVKAYRDQKLK